MIRRPDQTLQKKLTSVDAIRGLPEPGEDGHQARNGEDRQDDRLQGLPEVGEEHQDGADQGVRDHGQHAIDAVAAGVIALQHLHAAPQHIAAGHDGETGDRNDRILVRRGNGQIDRSDEGDNRERDAQESARTGQAGRRLGLDRLEKLLMQHGGAGHEALTEDDSKIFITERGHGPPLNQKL